MGPETMWVEASEVGVGDRIARRNTCGGFIEWMRVTAPLRHQCITVAAGGAFPADDGGGYAVRDADEMVEVAS